MSDNKTDIRLAMPYGGQGEFLTEASRAFLHAGGAAGLVRRVLEGVNQFRAEREQVKQDEGSMVEPAERIVMGELRRRLEGLYEEMMKIEDHEYSM